MLELRDEVSIALEEARREKRIGHSLDAALEIYPKDQAESDFLSENLALLKMLFIVSDARIGPVARDQAEAARTTVSSSDDAKCERCWMKDPGVGQNPEHPGLCPRCGDVIGRIESQ